MRCVSIFSLVFFFFKQKTAYEMRISDWSSDVCSSDLCCIDEHLRLGSHRRPMMIGPDGRDAYADGYMAIAAGRMRNAEGLYGASAFFSKRRRTLHIRVGQDQNELFAACTRGSVACAPEACRSEEHTSELQSLMRISYAVFCLKKHK